VARSRTRIDQSDENQNSGAVSDRRRRAQGVTTSQNGDSRKDRPTPSARQVKRGQGSTGLVNRIPVVRSIVAYFRGVASEMQKVTWPNRDETTRLTGVVLGVTIAFAIGLGMLDGFFSWWFQQAFHADSEWIFLVVAAAVTVILGGAYFAVRDRI